MECVYRFPIPSVDTVSLLHCILVGRLLVERSTRKGVKNAGIHVLGSVNVVCLKSGFGGGSKIRSRI